jgi:hypothetical protein
MKEYKISLANKNRSVIKNIYKKLSADNVNALSLTRTLGASQKFGNGYVIVFGDLNVAYGCSVESYDKFWQNVNTINGFTNGSSYVAVDPNLQCFVNCCSGPVVWGTCGSYLFREGAYPPVVPTVANVSADKLNLISGLWAGHVYATCIQYSFIQNTYWPQLLDWIKNGGILVLLGEFNSCDGGFNNIANNFLSVIKSQIQIEPNFTLAGCYNVIYYPKNCIIVDNNNIFINGSSYGGNIVSKLYVAATSYVTINTSVSVDSENEPASRIIYCSGNGGLCPTNC